MSQESGRDVQRRHIPRYRYTAELAGEVERHWQDQWQRRETFRAPDPDQPGSELPKFYLLDMFPYPSGAGLHVGHPLGYIGTDVLGRYLRMSGHNVLHTMGFDAFGLPAEQHAVHSGTHPRITTEASIARYRAQLRRLGLAHDERRSVATTDTDFYRWTQWIFLRIFNAWYDPEQDRARPVRELVAEFEAGKRATPDGRSWSVLDAGDRRRVVDTFRLAYVSTAVVNWCPGLGTVLANEEVTSEGRSERGNFPVFRRRLRQWMLGITAYADRLLADLDRLDWPEPIKAMQRNWIGRSEGVRIRFPLMEVANASVEVFTTRPDAMFGAAFLALAPEHPLVEAITADAWPDDVDLRWTSGAATPSEAVSAYRAAASARSERDRQANRSEAGAFTGSFVVNPVTGRPLPIFIAEYVLMGYGTGAIMGVPGQDQRDWDFAAAVGLPVRRTVQPPPNWAGEAYTGEGPATNAAGPDLILDGLGVDDAKRVTLDWLVARGAGRLKVQYRLRDWLFSRQRYWGEPFPVVWDEHGPCALPDDQLPVLLPDLEDYSPRSYDPDDADSEPEPPLARATEWVEVDLDLGHGTRPYLRETNTMPQWAGSCWYYLRYLDPRNDTRFVDPELERYWLAEDPNRSGDPGGVDLYVGGVEHAVLHLLYARFWHKVLFDLGEVTSQEPFRRLFNQGYIQAYAYTDDRGVYVPAEEVTEEQDGTFHWQGLPVAREYGKMGKSLRNVVTPDEMCARYGADTFRLYEMSTGPLHASRPWSTRDVVGSYRFLQRLWRLLVDEQTGDLRVTETEPDRTTLRLLHRTIAGVNADLTALRNNTAVAKLIELNNHLTMTYRRDGVPRTVAEPLVLMLAPLCPHVAEELWSRLGHDSSLAHGPFPLADPQWLTTDTVEYMVQVNGKLRGRVQVLKQADAEAIEAAALGVGNVAQAMVARPPRKVIVVPDRLVNFVL